MEETSILDRLRRSARVRERELLSERQAFLEQKCELILVALRKTREAIDNEDADAFAEVAFPRAGDIATTLKQLRDTRHRLSQLIAAEHES